MRPANRSERPVCLASSTLTPKRVPSCSSAPILARRSIEISTSGGLQRDRHERVRGHAVHLLADARREHRHAGREHPERAPEGDRRIALEPLSELERVGRRGTSSNDAPNASGAAIALAIATSNPRGASRFHERILTRTRGAAAAASLSSFATGSYAGGISSSRSAATCSSGIVGVSSRQCGPPCPARSAGRGTGAARSARTPKPMIFSFVPP